MTVVVLLMAVVVVVAVGAGRPATALRPVAAMAARDQQVRLSSVTPETRLQGRVALFLQ